MKAQRLPGKPLLKINGLSIISHVVKRAKETQIGEVIVATEDDEIIEDVKKNNGEAILTSKGHKSGTDRIWEAYKKLNIKNIEFIINLQGDEPLINLEDIRNLDFITKQNTSKITTLASKIDNEDILYDLLSLPQLQHMHGPKLTHCFSLHQALKPTLQSNPNLGCY